MNPGFQVRGGGGGSHLKKLRRAEGGTNILGVFRVKNHDFMPKYNIYFNFRGGGGGGGGMTGCATPWIRPWKGHE